MIFLAAFECPECHHIFRASEATNKTRKGEAAPGDYIYEAGCPNCGKRSEWMV